MSPQDQQPRRVVRLLIATDLFAWIFKAGVCPGHYVSDHPLPPDARIVDIRMHDPITIEALLESETFAEVLVGRDWSGVPELESPRYRKFTVNLEDFYAEHPEMCSHGEVGDLPR